MATVATTPKQMNEALVISTAVPFNYAAYVKELARLRAAGKHDDAKRLKTAAFGILYGAK
jgi:hypothetical protein